MTLTLISTITESSEMPGGDVISPLEITDWYDETPSDPDKFYHPCEAFFYEYVAAAGNFTHCQLLHAKPFRICTKCFEPYAIMTSLYFDLTILKNHPCCFFSSLGCIRNLKVDEKTKEVEYFVPKDVNKFISLYANISDCLMGNLSFDLDLDTKNDNISVLCKVCNENYQNLNDHYNGMSNSANGDVCMDVVDMMNYTRFTWSVDLNCSHRSGDAASVVIITLAVAISPLFFYLPLRYTSKEKIKTVLKQKRYEGFVSSTSASFAANQNSSTPARSLRVIAS
ncbi:osteopetrosis-associated transmembrane protein 1-like [Elysia marginata]|uniref:Osteopetrosis-associated transmembrane protein 1-like n=1 Tax=Elysia marginata TaxID=1093978 RepID=A0AAV4IIG6_9GAST|nr:osteopetrosis-associated transmembrane protein 1-like [Elysia marginata]